MQYFYLIIYQLILLKISSTNIQEETKRRSETNLKKMINNKIQKKSHQ